MQKHMILTHVDPDSPVVLLSFAEIFTAGVLILAGALLAGSVSASRLRRKGIEEPAFALFAGKEDEAEPDSEEEDYSDFEETVLDDRVADEDLAMKYKDEEEDEEEDDSDDGVEAEEEAFPDDEEEPDFRDEDDEEELRRNPNDRYFEKDGSES